MLVPEESQGIIALSASDAHGIWSSEQNVFLQQYDYRQGLSLHRATTENITPSHDIENLQPEYTNAMFTHQLQRGKRLAASAMRTTATSPSMMPKVVSSQEPAFSSPATCCLSVLEEVNNIQN